jgi:beta-glucosidase-like glycosyl hydrolase
MKRLATILAVSLAVPAPASPQSDAPLYKDARQPIDVRVADLLGRMTLEEKVAQLQALWIQKSKIYDDAGNFSPEKAKTVMPLGLGQIARPSESSGPGPLGPPKTREPRQHAEFVNAVQKYALSTRLGIPVMFHEEALHGLAAPKGTHFPIPMALGATWDPALVERVMSVAAKEARARGCQQVLSPVLDLARDPRWGRTEETYGEDPYHVTQLGLAAIRGYQGPGLPLAADKVFATAKHFAAHGPNEGGINTAPSSYGERYLREELLAPFEAAITQARPYAVMPSYNEIDGVPAHQNKWLLDTLLRGEWGFDGIVTSDYFAILQLKDRHLTAADAAEAARRSLLAGVDIELPDPDTFPTIVEQVKDGRIPQSAVDTAVARILRAKFLSGLFENPYVDVEKVDAQTNTPEHQALALEAARKAIVLVKNDKGVLPLDRKKIRTLAVIGPNAKGVHLGGYSRDPGRGIDVLDGITKAAGSGVRVLHAEGVRLTEEPFGVTNWWRDKVTLADPARNPARIRQAVSVAKQADAVVLVIGTNEALSREAWGDEHLGDATDLDLPGQQQELVDAVRATGKPVVALLLNGRPLSVTRVAETVPAILEGFYLGQEGGSAVGEVLFGDVNPGGRLPITFPRSVGQLPIWQSRKPTSFRDYIDSTRQPLWSFGHGLSYTTFEYSGLEVTPGQIGPAGAAIVKVTVKNTGQIAGDEVVQLYVHDLVASVTRPRRALKGFRRVTLAPGESREVSFALTPAELSFIGVDMKRVVEPGTFEVFVGGRPDALTSAKLEVVER